MIIPESDKTLLQELTSNEDFDENITPFSKYFGNDETLWKCSNLECSRRDNITGRELYLLDKDNMVPWQKFGPLTVVVFPLCHHCGSSLSQTYEVIIEDSLIVDDSTGAGNGFGPYQRVH